MLRTKFLIPQRLFHTFEIVNRYFQAYPSRFSFTRNFTISIRREKSDTLYWRIELSEPLLRDSRERAYNDPEVSRKIFASDGV